MNLFFIANDYYSSLEEELKNCLMTTTYELKIV